MCASLFYPIHKIMDAVQRAYDGQPVEKITKSRPPCVIL